MTKQLHATDWGSRIATLERLMFELAQRIQLLERQQKPSKARKRVVKQLIE